VPTDAGFSTFHFTNGNGSHAPKQRHVERPLQMSSASAVYFSNQAARVKDCEEGLIRRLQQPLHHNPPPGQSFSQSLQSYRRVCISLSV